MRHFHNYRTAIAVLILIGANLAAVERGGASPISIDSIQDLENITDLSGDYVLDHDIDAAGVNFVPIGFSSAVTTNSMVPSYGPFSGVNATPGQFTGTFDGQGHTIKNLTINNSGALNLGLFSLIGSTGTVRNLSVSGGSVSSGSTQNAGLLAGWNLGTITSVTASGAVVAGDNATNVGGLVGWNWGGTISDSRATGVVSVGNRGANVGGLVGFGGYWLASGGTVTDSSAVVHVGAGANSNAIGGLVGYLNSGVVRNSFAAGSVSSGDGSSWIGGLTGGIDGYWGSGLVATSFASGNVNGGSNSTNVGGLVGANIWAGAIADSYALGSVTGATAVGGLVGWNGYTGFPPVGASITTSYSTGAVTATGMAGGLVGYNIPNAVVSQSYWDTESSGVFASSDGIGLTTASLKSGVLPAGFDTNVWTAAAGQYPTLQWQAGTQSMCQSMISGAVHVSTSGISLTLEPAQIRADFTPKGTTLSGAAQACGYLGFDWIQRVIAADPKFAYANSDPSALLVAPFNDPPPTGYSNLQIGCPDRTISSAVNQAYPYYYFPDVPGVPGVFATSSDCMAVSQHQISDHTLWFFDMPMLPYTGSQYADFETQLVGIMPDGTPSSPLYDWTWKTTYHGGGPASCTTYFYVCPGVGGVSLANYPIPVPFTDGTGGITVLTVDGHSVPEPGALALFIGGIASAVAMRRRKRPAQRFHN